MIVPRLLLAASLLAVAPFAPTASGAQELPPRVDPVAVSKAISRGVQFLEEAGPRGKKGQKHRAGRSAGLNALILYTILKGGGSPHSEAVHSLLHELSLVTTLGTYDRGCLLLALAAHDPIAHRAWIESVTQGLIDSQDPHGAWAYPSGSADLSNTQYASLGLWAATKAGVHVEPAVWQALAERTAAFRSGQGGFGYRPGSGTATGSMTTAGIGTLALCEQELTLAGRLEPETGALLFDERKAGLDWLATHFSVTKNPNGGGHHFYYLYGLERMAAFAGLAKVGEHDWYAEGANHLIGRQLNDGSWSGSSATQTCFAVLFLARATSRGRKGPAISGPRVTSEWATEEKGASVRIACKVEHGQPKARVLGLSGRVLSDYVWPDSEGGGLRVQRVVYSVGGVPAATVLGAPENPLGATELPALLYPKRDGDLVARIYLAAPPGSDGLPRFVESPPLAVELASIPPSRPLRKGTEAHAQAARCSASTHFKPRPGAAYPAIAFDPKRIVDGNPSSPWLARPKDSAPKIKVTAASSTLAAGLIISPPTLPGYPEAPLRKPTRVLVTLNGKRQRSTEHDLSPSGRTTIPFPDPLKVRTIELTILATTGPVESPTGLGEVSILIPRG